MDSSVDNETLLVLRCVGLNVAAKTNFKNVGVLSNIFLRATGKTASNEKRTIKLAQSAPFKPNINGRPPNADFTQIYVSEIVEDTADATPSLVASVRCPAEFDCVIRLSVYYSSNLTAEKDVLLAGTSFTRKELLRAVHNKGVLISDMVSEHCPGSKAYVEVMAPMPNVLPDVATVLPSSDPLALEALQQNSMGFNITSPRSPLNPFKQRYVFYAEANQFEPLVHAEESTWEPRFSALLPAMFMENFTSALVRSINAWNMRYELERKRQGRFRSLKEAIQHGWHSVNVTVHATRIGASRQQTERVRQQQLMQEQALLVAALTEQSGAQGGANGGAVNNRNSARYNRQLSVATDANKGALAGAGGATGPILPTYNVCIPVPEDPDEVTEMDVQVAEGAASVARGVRGRVLHDETAPSTFVEVSIQDQSQMFLLPLGRTNTEYYNLNPVYGSNINAVAAGRKAVTAASVTADCVEICIAEKELSFYSFDTTDRDAVARHFAQHWHHRRQVYEAQAQQQSAATGAVPEGSAGSHSGSLSSTGSVSQSNSLNNSAHGGVSGVSTSNSGAVRAVSTDYNNHSPLRQVNASVLQSVLPATLSNTIPIPPLPLADSVHKVMGKEAHFYRFVSTCHQSAVLFEVCVEDPNNGNKKRIGTCTLPISPGCRKDLWLPVRFQNEKGGDIAEGEYESMEVHVSVSVKSPFDEDQDPLDINNNICDGPARHNSHDKDRGDRDRDYFSTKPSPAAMPEVLVYQRTVQGPPARQDEVKELQQRRSRASSAVDSGIHGHSGGSGAAHAAGLASTSKDDLDAVHPNAGAEHKLSELGDYRGTIADAYEWMWYVGFNGIDPLLLDEEVARRRRPTSMNSVNTANTANTASAPSSRPTSTQRPSHNTPPVTPRVPTPEPPATGAPTAMVAEESDNREGETEEDFQEHFESSRMSVFASETPEQLLSSKDAADFAASPGLSRKERELAIAHLTDEGDEEEDGRGFASTEHHLPASAAVDAAAVEMEGDSEDIGPAVSVSVQPFASAHDLPPAPSTPPPAAPVASQHSHHHHAGTADVPHHLPPSPPGSPPTTRYAKRARVDYSYPLEWIRSHVTSMEALAMELGSLVPLMKTAHKECKSFRASALKKQAEWQALPVNLHYQLMSVRPYSRDPELSSRIHTEVVHSVTCGAMTPHMLGHKKGGLYYQESKLVTSKGELDRCKAQFVEKLHMAGGTRVSTSPAEPFGVHKRLQELGEKTLQFESVCLQICHRRAYAISQSLSIAVNSLLLKIGLTIQGSVPERVAEQWLSCGILLVFEGLLSVVAHERSMLEDTISAVDALRSFQVRLLPYPDEAHHYFASKGAKATEAPVPPPPSPTETETAAAASAGATAGAGADLASSDNSAAELNLDNMNFNIEVDAATSAAFNTDAAPSSAAGDIQPSTTNSSTANASAAPAPAPPVRTLKLELRGREVLVYVPHASLRRLPQSYQVAAYTRGGAVIPLYSVLFTQGIDIQQTMVTTFGGDSAQGRTNNLHLQHDVNLKGLRDVNAYCMKALPVSTDYLSSHHVYNNVSSSSGAGRSLSTGNTPSAAAQKRLSHNNNNSNSSTNSNNSNNSNPNPASHSAKVTHPMCKTLHDTILSSSLTLKNVDLLIEVERLSVMLGGIRVTFCKSGKDRTGMACTLDQSRQLGERYGCGMSVPRALKDANLMRVHGCRLLIAEKNIGRKVYSINRMQAQFLPLMFRPPASVCEDLLKKDNS